MVTYFDKLAMYSQCNNSSALARIWPLRMALVMSKLTGVNVLCMGRIYGRVMAWWRNHHVVGQLGGDCPCKEGSLGILHQVTFMHNIYIGVHVKCQLLLSEINQNFLSNFKRAEYTIWVHIKYLQIFHCLSNHFHSVKFHQMALTRHAQSDSHHLECTLQATG
jgi:hypothetical protein